MEVLVLGGTAWLGRAVARHALGLGHAVTCLACGESGAPAPGARLVVADRGAVAPGDGPDPYAALPRQEWDLVIELTWQPGFAVQALRALSDQAHRWVYVSSGSVYADHGVIGGGQELPLLDALDTPRASREEYGAAKVACEQAVRAVRGPDALIARSGLIAGYGDPSDRFGYWVGRCALAVQDGGPLLVPERTGRPAQLVDVLDLSAWLVDAALCGCIGTVDAYGPRHTLEDVIAQAEQVTGFGGPRVPVGDAVLRERGIEEFMGKRSLALWMAHEQWQGFSAHDDSSAVGAGLVARPLEETTRAALVWERELGLSRTDRAAGLDRDDELRLIALTSPGAVGDDLSGRR